MSVTAGDRCEDPAVEVGAGDPGSDPAAAVSALLVECDDLPATRNVAMALLRLMADESVGTHRLGEVAMTDPALSARILRMANSAYYGLSSRVGTVPFAVTVLGTSTLRSLAVMAVNAELGDGALPPGFWEHGLTAAVAAAAAATRLGGNRNDAFCGGMLHDFGSGLLFRADRAGHTELVAAAGGDQAGLCRLEHQRYGVDHPTVAARVLSAWNLPARLCDAVQSHHASQLSGDALTRAVQLGGLVAARVSASFAPSPGSDPALQAAASSAGLDRAAVRTLVEEAAEGARQLAGSLLVRT